MSGGSLDYLYSKTLSYGCGDDGIWALELALERVERTHPGTRAAINLRALRDGIRALDKLHRSLAPVLQAIEWDKSGDTLDDTDEAVEKYERTSL